MGFYFDRVYLVSGEKLEAKAAASGAAGPGGKPGPGHKPPVSKPPRPGSGGGPKSGGALSEAALIDPVTHESIINDWEFEIWVDAIMQDYEEVASKGEGRH
jgi:hypothetical protein